MQRNVCRDNVTWSFCSRLYALYDPFVQLHIATCVNPRDYPSIRKYEPVYGYRDIVYHYGRINYFIRQIEKKKKIQPVRVSDNIDFPHPCYLKAIVHDGHHRFAACIKTGKRTMPIEYTGEPGLLAYLQGKINSFTK